MTGTAFPKIPESNWWKLRDQFKKTLPAAVTTPYLRSLLGLKSEGAAQNLVGPLRQIGLIDDSGKPTPRANDWRNDAKYKEVCAAILGEIYPQELRDLYSGASLDRGDVETWFMHSAALGQAAAARNAQLYILLNEGAPRSSEDRTRIADTKPKATKSENRARGRAAIPGDTPQTATSSPVVEPPRTAPPYAGGGPTVHMDLQIHISPDAGSEQIEAIFAAMAKHLYSK